MFRVPIAASDIDESGEMVEQRKGTFEINCLPGGFDKPMMFINISGSHPDFPDKDEFDVLYYDFGQGRRRGIAPAGFIDVREETELMIAGPDIVYDMIDMSISMIENDSLISEGRSEMTLVNTAADGGEFRFHIKGQVMVDVMTSTSPDYGRLLIRDLKILRESCADTKNFDF